MTEEVRCQQCGARNSPEAAWCTQCYTPFTPAASPAPESATAESATAESASPPPPTAAGVPPPPSSDPPDGLLPLPPAPGATPSQPTELRAGSGKFRQGPAGLEWTCEGCGEWNSIDRVSCSVCQTPFGAGLGADEPPRADVTPAVLTLASLAVPGAGHWLLGLRGPAVLRALLGLVWGLGGITLLLRARGSGQSVLPAVPLLLGWAVVAAGSANDAIVEAGGDGRVVLGGRTLLWLTLGVVGGTFAAVLVGVLAAVGG